MSNKIKIIGITGLACAGKDTFFSLLDKSHPEIFKRFAFADELKSHLAVFIYERFGFDIYNCLPDQKELIRPILIAYGQSQRKVDINYWVKQVYEEIRQDFFSRRFYIEPIYVITDFRFESEVKFFKELYGDSFVLVEIVRKDAGNDIPNEEKEEMPRVRPYVNHIISWPTVGKDKLDLLNSYIDIFYQYAFFK